MIRVRIDSKTKEKVVQILDKMGLTVSDAVCILLVRIAEGDVFTLILKRLTPKLILDEFRLSLTREEYCNEYIKIIIN
ncbi:MAG: type II toxin-antitoxin system RelB/DinJ family antitoxin [Acetomicrobium sp.]|nr:type II toxin-antitoxin system RelB/DinJ family antitoxin [Acetomicrobium sp.]